MPIVFKIHHSLSSYLFISRPATHIDHFWCRKKNKEKNQTFLEIKLSFSPIFWQELRSGSPAKSKIRIRLTQPSNRKIVRISGFYPDRINPDENPSVERIMENERRIE